MLDLVHRALKIAEQRLGPEHAEAVKLRRMCQSLARRYAEEEAAALQAKSPAKGDGLQKRGSEELASEWLRRNGLDLKQWGLDESGPRSSGGGDEDAAANVERIVAKLKSG